MREFRWLAGLLGLLVALTLAADGVAIVGLRARPAAPKAATHPTLPVQQRVNGLGAEALGLVSFDITKLGYQIQFRPQQAGVRAQTDHRRRLITIFINPTDVPHRIAHDIAHEMGHAYDFTLMNQADRQHYLQLRGRPNAPWWPGLQAQDYTTLAVTDYGVGSGDFAEVFARCHAPAPEFRSTLAPPPPAACALIPTVPVPAVAATS